MRRLLTAFLVAQLVVVAVAAPASAGTPQADDLNPTGPEDGPLIVTLTATEPDGLDITAFTPTDGAHGQVALTGSLDCDTANPRHCSQDATYTPVADFFGSDAFTYTATSDGTPSPTATVNITITPVNDVPSFTKGANVIAPVATAVTKAAWASSISAGPGESDALTFSLDPVDPSLFTVAPAIDATTGDLTFTTGATAGSTSVSVTVRDDGSPIGTSAAQSFTVTVLDGPVADELVVTLTEDDPATPITLTGADPQGDPLTFAIATPPAHGDLSGVSPDLSYTPDPDYFGPDSFTYTASDGSTVSPPALVSITVASGNNDPVLAKSDFVKVTATTTTTLNPLANDSGGSGETLAGVTITAVTKPSKGSATITANGTRVSYDPAGCASGEDVFSYTISDGGSTSTKSVAVTINRPGQGGLSTSPLTDTPAAAFITGSTMGTSVPMKLSWCGVTTSTTSVRSYRLLQSTNGGSTYPTTLFSATTAKSSTRNLSVSTNYRWRARTVDTAGRTGSYRTSQVTRITRYQDSNARFTYTAGWRTSTAGTPSGGTERYTSTVGAAATITVTNVRAFALVGPRSSTRGSLKVFVDGLLVKNLSERASTTAYRRVLYWRTISTGSHTIRIEAAGGGRVDLDAILTISAP